MIGHLHFAWPGFLLVLIDSSIADSDHTVRTHTVVADLGSDHIHDSATSCL